MDDCGVQARLGLVGRCDADAGEPGGLQQIRVLAPGEGAVDAADPPLGVGEPVRVDAFVGDDVADAQPPAGA